MHMHTSNVIEESNLKTSAEGISLEKGESPQVLEDKKLNSPKDVTPTRSDSSSSSTPKQWNKGKPVLERVPTFDSQTFSKRK